MPEPQNVQPLLEQAKHAADAGDLASADALLQDAARIQEAELGPLHPELANIVNNLAIVAEMAGRLDDAEIYYRRALSIASASLPPDDSIVASSRKNLEDFCREYGLPFDRSPAAAPVQPSEPRLEEFVRDQSAGEPNTRADLAVAEASPAVQISAAAPEAVSDAHPTEDAAERSSVGAASPTRWIAIAGIGVVALVVAVLLATRPSSPREPPPRGQIEAPAPSPAAQPTPPPAAAPIEQPQPPTVASRDDKAVTANPRGPGRSSAGISLVTSQLCRTLSVANNWRCDPAGQSVAPGSIVLYTRVRSPRDATVIHQWYRGETLTKSARLSILSNTTDGYRTFSRQTVRSGENWRVEVRTTDGALLYEQRVSVQ